MTTRVFRPSDELDAALVATAEREGRSIQEVMRTAVAQYVDARGARIDAAVDRVLAEDGELLHRLGTM